jgi:cation-transporting P-type ATPase E
MMNGLTSSEVLARRAAGQGNDIALPTSRSYAEILRENVFTFINYVLFGLGIALVVMGRVSDALVSVGVVLVNTLVGVIQEVRAKRTLDKIALLTRPKATVIRDGRERVIDPAEVVLGDLLAVAPGDQIVVDGRATAGARLEVDESLLTGESDLIHKEAGDPVYSGSFCATGGGRYLAEKVGADTLIYEITQGARAFRRIYTPLQQQINLVIRLILLIAIYFELLVVISASVRGSSLVEIVQMSVVIVGLIPNGLFLAIAAAYGMGAVRMAGKGALVQQSNAVESLSNVDVLCLDKTGTLTANKIELDAIHPWEISHSDLESQLAAIAASISTGNRTSEAIAAAYPGQPEEVLVEVPFSSARRWSGATVAGRGSYLLGAPEAVRPYLAAGHDLATINDQVAAATSQGLRVLFFAQLPPTDEPDPWHDQTGQPHLREGLQLLGILWFRDMLRDHVHETLRGFQKAGIQLKIISGDNPDTVAALARQAGMPLPEASAQVSGTDMATMEPGQRAQIVREATIFGRVSPQQKEELVKLLQADGRYVAMVGDGVNDVLALKRADVGVAMESGSQAARGVADMILLDDAFEALPHAFREGQRIINGMQGVLKLFLTRVLYAALLILSTAVVGGFPFTPKHNALLTLITVGIPAIALAAWARPGARHRQQLVRNLFHFVLPASLTLGLMALSVYLFYFFFAAELIVLRQLGPDAPVMPVNPRIVAQGVVTSFTVFCGLMLVLFAEPPSRLWTGGSKLRGDKRPLWLVLFLLAAYLTILAVPGLRAFFDLIAISLADYMLIIAMTLLWAIMIRLTWRFRLLERYLSIQLLDDQKRMEDEG